MGNSENKEAEDFEGGHIVVELKDNNISFVAGQVIEGSVHV